MYLQQLDPAFLAVASGGTPALDLFFSATKALDSRITFSRGSSGTFINSSGLVETAASGVARFTHNPSTLASLGLLIEESRTNLLLRSEEFNDAAWTKALSTIGANSAAAPSGADTADKLQETATTGIHRCRQQGTASASGAHTFSFFAKSAERSRVVVVIEDGAGTNGGFAVFNLSTGVYDVSATTFGAGFTSLSTSAQAFSGGWFRVSITATVSPATSISGSINLDAGTSGAINQSYAGVAGNGIFVWGAQLEAGAFATSYIPTTSATVTRAADVATMTGTNFSSWYRQGEGTITIAFSRGGTSGQAMRISDGTSNNRIQLGHNSSNLVELTVTVSGAAQGPVSTAAQLAPVSAAFAYALNNVSVTRNAAVPTLDTTSLIPAVDQIEFGAAGGVGYLNGTIARIRYYRRRLPDANLQTLTT